MKKALITGIAGFAGSHLAQYLVAKNITVFGLFHPKHPTANIDFLKDKIQLIPCDILNQETVEKEILSEDFDYVFHLAAFSSPPESLKNPKETLENNILSQLNLLDALVKAKSKAKILIIGSADEYGEVDPKYLPINESAPLNPTTPYAVSKVVQDMLGLQYFLHYKLDLVRVRPFNHIGPRQSKAFVVSSFAAQIAAVEKKGGGTIKVGNLETWRDFTDVRDMVRAYLLALDKGKVGDFYNVGSGQVYKIENILKELISLSKAKIKVLEDKSLLRTEDTRKKYCDFSKFRKQTGWKPQIPISKTLFDTIEYERKKLKSEARNSKY